VKVLSSKDLVAKGVALSREQRYRLTKEGKFPRPFHLHEASRRLYWDESVIDQWLADRANKAKAIHEQRMRNSVTENSPLAYPPSDTS
jgi:predicted DNA-binding transcriptional regulator AlpA